MRTKEEYQEALDELESFIVEQLAHIVLSINHFNQQINLLQELIDNLEHKQDKVYQQDMRSIEK